MGATVCPEPEIGEKTPQIRLTVNEKKTKYKIVSATQKGRQTQNWKVGDKSI